MGDQASRQQELIKTLKKINPKHIPQTEEFITIHSDCLDFAQLIFRAINDEEKEIALDLVECGPDVEQRNEDGYTLLQLSIIRRHFDCADKLITLGSSLSATTPDGKNALRLSIESSDTVLINTCLDHGMTYHDLVDEIIPGDNETLLYKAINSNNAFIEHLAKSSKYINHPDNYGYTPFDLAVCSLNKYQAEILIKHGANLSAGSFNTKIHFAVKNSSIEMAEYLIQEGDDLYRPNEEGLTPIDLSIINKNTGMIAFFKKIQADFSKNSQVIIYYGKNIGVDLKFALTFFEYPDQQDKKGFTVYHWLVINNRLDDLKTLLADKRLNPNIPDYNGVTPLYLSLESKKFTMSSLLIDACDIFYWPSSKSSPLGIAIKFQQIDIALKILNKIPEKYHEQEKRIALGLAQSLPDSEQKKLLVQEIKNKLGHKHENSAVANKVIFSKRQT